MTWLLDCMFFDYFQWMNFKLININGLHLQELAHKQLRKLNIDENEIFSSKENGCTFLQICRPKIRSYKLCYTRLLFIWWVSNKIFIFLYDWHLQCFFINVIFIIWWLQCIIMNLIPLWYWGPQPKKSSSFPIVNTLTSILLSFAFFKRLLQASFFKTMF